MVNKIHSIGVYMTHRLTYSQAHSSWPCGIPLPRAIPSASLPKWRRNVKPKCSWSWFSILRFWSTVCPGVTIPQLLLLTLVGFRICPGRFLSMNSLFVNMACILHTFNIVPALDADGKPIRAELRSKPGMIWWVVPISLSKACDESVVLACPNLSLVR